MVVVLKLFWVGAIAEAVGKAGRSRQDAEQSVPFFGHVRGYSNVQYLILILESSRKNAGCSTVNCRQFFEFDHFDPHCSKRLMCDRQVLASQRIIAQIRSSVMHSSSLYGFSLAPSHQINENRPAPCSKVLLRT